MTTDITRQQFLQALRDHPEWREEVRLQVLGEEIMRLPVAFQAFVVQQEKFNDEMRDSATTSYSSTMKCGSSELKPCDASTTSTRGSTAWNTTDHG